MHMLSKTSLQIALLVLGEILGLVIVFYCELLSCLLNFAVSSFRTCTLFDL